MRASRALFNFLKLYLLKYLNKCNLYYTVTITLSTHRHTIVKICNDNHSRSSVREPIDIAEKQQQYFDICDYRRSTYLFYNREVDVLWLYNIS